MRNKHKIQEWMSFQQNRKLYDELLRRARFRDRQGENHRRKPAREQFITSRFEWDGSTFSIRNWA